MIRKLACLEKNSIGAVKVVKYNGVLIAFDGMSNSTSPYLEATEDSSVPYVLNMIMDRTKYYVRDSTNK